MSGRAWFSAMVLIAGARAASGQTPIRPNAASDSATKTPAYDAVVAGMSCRQKTSGEMSCDYRIGSAIHFMIMGVGQADVSVVFLKIDEDGAYAASIAPLNGCVRVTSKVDAATGASPNDIAFVSPHDGKVYRYWNACLKQPVSPPSKKP